MNRKTISFMVLFPVAASLFSVLNGCESEREGPARIIDLPDDAPEEEGRKTTIIVSDSSWTKAVMQVGHARKYSDQQETLIDSGIAVRFLDRNGNVNALLLADSARVDDKTGDMCAFGAVTVHSPRNRTLVTTDKLCYEKEAGRLHSDSRVHVVDSLRGRDVHGVGYESDEALKRYKIYKVTGEARGTN